MFACAPCRRRVQAVEPETGRLVEERGARGVADRPGRSPAVRTLRRSPAVRTGSGGRAQLRRGVERAGVPRVERGLPERARRMVQRESLDHEPVEEHPVGRILEESRGTAVGLEAAQQEVERGQAVAHERPVAREPPDIAQPQRPDQPVARVEEAAFRRLEHVRHAPQVVRGEAQVAEAGLLHQRLHVVVARAREHLLVPRAVEVQVLAAGAQRAARDLPDLLEPRIGAAERTRRGGAFGLVRLHELRAEPHGTRPGAEREREAADAVQRRKRLASAVAEARPERAVRLPPII